jgi:2-oxoglutarate dehydrogenase E2 component (dihydrolipoamide succinyltransferase)
VRRIAREHGIALDQLTGTGRRGRVTREDLLLRIDGRAKPAPSPMAPMAPMAPAGRVYRPPVVQPGPADTVEPFTRRRSYIAEHLSHSLVTAAHVAAVVEIDMSRVLRAKKVRDAASAGTKLSVTAFVVEALARALAEHPRLNAAVGEQAGGRALILRGERNIGVAVDTPEGLVVPVIHRADELNLLGIARAIEELSAKARAGSLTAAETSGGTFTLSNPGRDGNLFGISILRQPEVGILRMGEIKKRPVALEVDGEDAIAIRPIMFAALSYDHRVIDGRTGNAFLHRIRALLESVEV